MSRAINLNATLAEVTARCAQLAMPFTSIETLRSGGTRVVMKNANDAVAVSRAYGKKVLTGAVTRQPSRLTHYQPAEPVAMAPRSRWLRD